MNRLWVELLRYSARQSKIGSVRAWEGLEATWVNSTLPFLNGTFFTSAPANAADLERRLEAAKTDAAAYPLPWGLYTYDPDFVTYPIASESGFERVLSVRVMTGNVAHLTAPVRPLPPVEFRRIVDGSGARHAFDINMQAYGLPAEISESLLATQAFFGNLSRDFGYVAYANGKEVSTTSVLLLDDWLYVALVATAKGHQKKGYAEAVMRHALQQAAAATGVTRTSLDATDAGAPLYEQMGYKESGETWGLWTLSH